MSEIGAMWQKRLVRLRKVSGVTNLIEVSGPATRSGTPLLAVTSSRLGADAFLHRSVCQYLRRSLIDCKHRGCELLVASGSAIEPWAVRAAELFGVPCRKLANASGRESGDVCVTSGDETPISVDAAVIGLADRVDAVFVRRGGLIATCLKRRLLTDLDASVRVAVTADAKCAAGELIQQGAIGWLDFEVDSLFDCPTNRLSPNSRIVVGDCAECLWGQSEGHWLIHCTRGRVGPWPNETQRQYRDSMILGPRASAQRGPLDALLRIIKSGHIIASATASNHRYPVVCFSALSLQSLLDMRCFRPHLGRWDYEPFGVAIRIAAAQKLGVQPVIYGNNSARDSLPEQDRFRFHPRGQKRDWRREREWRSHGSIDLLCIDPQDIRVFAYSTAASRTALSDCRWPVSFLATAGSSHPSV